MSTGSGGSTGSIGSKTGSTASTGSGGSTGSITSNNLDADADPFEPDVMFGPFVARSVGTSAGRSDDALWPRGQPIPKGQPKGSRRTKTYDDDSGNRKFGTVMGAADARALAKKARREKLDVVFDQSHSKGGRNAKKNMSKERYDRYKALTKMEDILKAENEDMTYSWSSGPSDTVMRHGKNKYGKGGDDLAFDIEHGIAMIKSGDGGFLRAALAKKAAPSRVAVQVLQAKCVLPVKDPLIEAGIKWAEQSGIDAERGGAQAMPMWLASACAAQTVVMADGMIEPVTIEEAMRLPEWKLWFDAIEKEVKSLIEMGTWEEVDESVPASRGKKILPSKMVLKVKLKQNEEGVMVLDKVKCRLTAGGQVETILRR